MRLITSDPSTSTDNPISVAWMGWEYLNAGLTTDITNKNIHPFNSIPLGNYIDYMASSFKGVGRIKKFDTNRQRVQESNAS